MINSTTIAPRPYIQVLPESRHVPPSLQVAAAQRISEVAFEEEAAGASGSVTPPNQTSEAAPATQEVAPRAPSMASPVASRPEVAFDREERHGDVWLKLPYPNDDKRFMRVHWNYFKSLFPDKDLSNKKVCQTIVKEYPILRWAPNRTKTYTRHGIPMATAEDGMTDGEILTPFPSCQPLFMKFFEANKDKIVRGAPKTVVRGMKVVRDSNGGSDTESEAEEEGEEVRRLPPPKKKEKRKPSSSSSSSSSASSSKKRKKVRVSEQEASPDQDEMRQYTSFLSGLIGSVGQIPNKERDAVADFATKSFFSFQQQSKKSKRA